MEVKLVSKIGAGFNGTVYSAKVDGTPCILKVEKYNGDNSTKSSFGREIDFAYFVQKFPNNFMNLQHFSVIENCNHKQIIPKDMCKKYANVMNRKNSNKKCSLISYLPVLEFTWADRPKLTDKQYNSAFYQLMKSINIMHTAGYVHRDIHAKNIMGRRVGNNYQWFLIDYGLVYHPKFIPNASDESYFRNDIFMLINMILTNNILHTNLKNIKVPIFKDVIKRIIDDRRFPSIKKYLPKTNNIAIYNDCVLFITVILHYDLYLEAHDLDLDKYSKYMTVQNIKPELLLYTIKHCCDKRYDRIVKYIHSKL
jgi:serine/threonine protein kinase